MSKNYYFKYAVYTGTNTTCIMRVDGGSFATDAFMQSDEAFNRIIADTFTGFFGDNGMHANGGRRNVRRFASEEEFNKMYEESCDLFKLVDQILDEVETQKLHRGNICTWELLKPIIPQYVSEHNLTKEEMIKQIKAYLNK